MILVTGGAGYIGSHTVLVLLQAGHDVVVLDNLVNSSAESLRRVGTLAGKTATFIEGDIRDRAALDALFARYPITSVIHFAGLKAVGESVEKPLPYYENNVSGSITLFEAMAAAGVKRIVFSSSATVYGEAGGEREYREDMPIGVPSSPYGQSKVMIEQILRDTARADDDWSVALLRYFNPIGASRSSPSTATTTTPRTAPACATTSTSWIWQKGTSRRCKALTARPAYLPGISAAANPARCWTSCAPMKKPAARPSRTNSHRAAPVTCPPSGRTRTRPPKSSAGAPAAAWTIWSPTPGAGSRKTRWVIVKSLRPSHKKTASRRFFVF